MIRTSLISLSNSVVADSPPNNITAAGVRDFNDELITSGATLLDDNTYTALNTFNEAVICNQDLYTGYQLAVTPQTTIDLTAVIGNYIEISGSPDVIQNFGACFGGEIRFLKFYDPCQLSPVGNISVPTGQTINVESGDTCTVIGKDNGSWVVVNYQRASGLPLNAGVVQSWTVNPAAPTLNEFNPPYQLGYRWVSLESGTRRKEWISDADTSSAAVWNPMGGSFGIWGDGKDLEIDYIDVSNFAGFPFLTYDIRYIRVSNKIILRGLMSISEVDGLGGFIEFGFPNNNQGLNFDDTTMVGSGVFDLNGKAVPYNEFSVYTLNTNKLYVESGTTLQSDTINIQFWLSIFLND